MRNWLRRLERGFDGIQNDFRLGGLGNHMENAAIMRQTPSVLLAVGRAMEDDMGISRNRIGAKLANKFKPVHARHENVGNDQIRHALASQNQRLFSIGSFDRLMAGVSDEQ